MREKKYTVLRKEIYLITIVSLVILIFLVIIGPYYVPIVFTDSVLLFSYIFIILMICIDIIRLLFGKYSHKIIINEMGVRYIKRNKEYLLPWDRIKRVSIQPHRYGIINKFSMLTFESGFYLKYDVHGENEYDCNKVRTFDENFFAVQYRRKIVQEVEKYWNEPIKRLYQVEGKSRLST